MVKDRSFTLLQFLDPSISPDSPCFRQTTHCWPLLNIHRTRPIRRIVLTFVFSKVAIFDYLWKTFKCQRRNICFKFEAQRSLQTKTLKLQRLQKFEWNNVDTFADTFAATIEKTKVKNNHLPRSSWPHSRKILRFRYDL